MEKLEPSEERLQMQMHRWEWKCTHTHTPHTYTYTVCCVYMDIVLYMHIYSLYSSTSVECMKSLKLKALQFCARLGHTEQQAKTWSERLGQWPPSPLPTN